MLSWRYFIAGETQPLGRLEPNISKASEQGWATALSLPNITLFGDGMTAVKFARLTPLIFHKNCLEKFAMASAISAPIIHLSRLRSALMGASSICKSFLVTNSDSSIAALIASVNHSACFLQFSNKFVFIKSNCRHDSRQ